VQAGQLILVRTNPVTQFIGAQAQNAEATLNLGPAPPGTAFGDGYVDQGLGATSVASRLRAILLQSAQKLQWEVWLWADALYRTVGIGLQHPLGIWNFAEANAFQGSDSLYTYYVDGLDVPYYDLLGAGQIHLMLINRDATTKLAGASGAMQIQLTLEPTYGR